MSFEDEIGEAFAEVATKGMPVPVLLTNRRLSGVVQTLQSADHLREAGYEVESAITVAIPVAKLAVDPDNFTRERLEVLKGPLAGVYSAVKCNADAAHYVFTAIPVEGV